MKNFGARYALLNDVRAIFTTKQKKILLFSNCHHLNFNIATLFNSFTNLD